MYASATRRSTKQWNSLWNRPRKTLTQKRIRSSAGFFFFESSDNESEIKICEKIPHCNYTDSNQFRYIKVPFKPAVEEPYKESAESQPEHRNGKEFTVLGKSLGIGTVKRPIPVEKVIAAGCHCKPDGIGDVFLNSYNLFKKPGEAEINENAGETNNPEFEKFQNECPVEIVKHVQYS